MPLAPLIFACLAPFMWFTIAGAACGLPGEALSSRRSGAGR